MVSILLSVALADGPSNGDFEAGLAPWVDVSGALSGAEVRVVMEGEDLSDLVDTTGWDFPDGSGALFLEGGNSAAFTAAGADSDAFRITHSDVRFAHVSEDAEVRLRFLLMDGTSNVFDTLVPNATMFEPFEIDVEAFCGRDLRVRFVQFAGAPGDRRFSLVDGIEVGETPCSIYTDADGDGVCPHGIDTDGDGLCVGEEAEPRDAPERDCDDADAGRFPGNPEIQADGVDQDCDGIDPTGDCYSDDDGDGFGDTVLLANPACDGPNQTLVSGDCDDDDPLISPTAAEIPADGVDQDCDGTEACFEDLDLDTYGGSTLVHGPLDCSGAALNAEDCDDTLGSVNPGRPELCNGIDDDCNGLADDGLMVSTWYFDADGDGYGVTDSRVDSCSFPGDGFVALDGDCDDARSEIAPDAEEGVADGVDQNCDLREACFVDADGDGFGTLDVIETSDLDCAASGVADNSDDCDDTRPEANPDAAEIPDNLRDEDCDGLDAQTPTVEPPSSNPDDFEYVGGASCATSRLPTRPWWMGRRR